MVRLAMEGMKGSGTMLNGMEWRRGSKVEEDRLAVRRECTVSIHRSQGLAFEDGMRSGMQVRIAVAR